MNQELNTIYLKQDTDRYLDLIRTKLQNENYSVIGLKSIAIYIVNSNCKLWRG